MRISLRGLSELTWLELKIFLREPMGAIFTIGLPVIAFAIFGRVLPRADATLRDARVSSGQFPSGMLGVGGLPTLVSLLIVVSAVISLVTIISIYREGGILKRLRATPLRPYTILTAHVLVKLILTAITMCLMIVAGKRYFIEAAGVPVFTFAIALLLSTWSILSIGFVIASLVPTARFAQPIAAMVIYPMIAVSGLFVPLEALPPGLRRVFGRLPFAYVVSLLEGVWRGDGLFAHLGDISALVIVFLVCVTISARVFRWE